MLPVAACVLIAAFLQLVVKPNMGDFYAKMLLDIGANVILAVSLTMVNGFTGQFSMGHAAFMAVGAYVAAGLVYYGSGRLFQTDDFADAGIHGGVLSTMLIDRRRTPPPARSSRPTPAPCSFLLKMPRSGRGPTTARGLVTMKTARDRLSASL